MSDLYVTVCVLHSLPYFETSAATGQNVEKAVSTLLDLVMVRMEKSVELSRRTPNGTKVGAGDGEKSGCGC